MHQGPILGTVIGPEVHLVTGSRQWASNRAGRARGEVPAAVKRYTAAFLVGSTLLWVQAYLDRVVGRDVRTGLCALPARVVQVP